ncbi:MAG: peptide chain release factor N(5)-glutamine methyltransferase [Clostridia bacterium]|nr:peptide chain release factor N(5)-glutamine methyltransferase [Clostridia bacterium]
MTYNEICNLLSEAGVENNRAEAAMLICRFCNISRVELFKRSTEDFSSEELDAAVIKRCSHYPLQYILGIWEFCRESYRVNEHTLIPRQDTEILVEKAVSLLPERARFIDLCTGSGCVAVSTLAARPDCRAVAVDLFPETVDIAGENAEQNGVGDRLGLLVADVMEPSFMEELGTFDCIVSNPPYIETGKIDLLEEELFYEPRAALDGGADGLDFYRKIISEYGKYLRDGGGMLFEIGYDQADAVSEIARENGYKCEIFKDYGENDRVARLFR